MTGLVIFLAGLIIGTIVEPWPNPVKTVVWVALAVIGVVMGALGSFKV